MLVCREMACALSKRLYSRSQASRQLQTVGFVATSCYTPQERSVIEKTTFHDFILTRPWAPLPSPPCAGLHGNGRGRPDILRLGARRSACVAFGRVHADGPRVELTTTTLWTAVDRAA